MDTDAIATTGFGEWTVPAPTEDQSARYYAARDALTEDQKSDPRVARAAEAYGTDYDLAVRLLEEVLADVPSSYVWDTERAHAAAIREAVKREARARTFDVGDVEEDRSLHTRDNYRKVERTMQAAVDSIADGSELALMLELEAKLQAMIDQKILAMTDKTLPARMRFSTRELAKDTGLSHQSIYDRARKAVTGRRKGGPQR